MKILVTGGAGYIGSVTSELLLDQGFDVIVFDNLERGHRSAIDKRARLIEGDLRDRGKIEQSMLEVKPDAVMHFAAYALVGESMTDPEKYMDNNVNGGLNLARAMLRADVGKIVFSSTCATYGAPEQVPITEDEKQSPENPYGESKLMFEKALNWYHRIHGMQTVFLRYFNASGATSKFGEDHDPETHLIPLVLKTALGKRESISILGEDYATPDGTCIRDYIHIVDLAQAHIEAVTRDVSGAFNLGNGNGYSVKEVIDIARLVTGREIRTVSAERRPGDPPQLIAAANKARTELGWRPRFPDLATIIESAWDWHQRFPDGYGS